MSGKLYFLEVFFTKCPSPGAMNNHFMVKSVCQARELNPGPSAFRAAALPLSYEAGMNLQGATFEHALLLCELLVTLTAAGFCI